MTVDSRTIIRIAEDVMSRLDDLAAISADSGSITRLHLTPEHRRANELTTKWMNTAGMTTRVDEAGNLIGRYEGTRTDAPTLIIGSHLDTVRDAGRYDGTLGVMLGIAVVGLLEERRQRLPFAIEVIGFADEEGVRFRAGLLGSRAITGKLEANVLDLVDDDGVTLRDALLTFGLEPGALERARKDPSDVIGFLEIHIEQGPVLENERAPVGVVTAIAGAFRRRVTISGKSGHAGTVPMPGRRDALTAAAQCVLALESLCLEETGVVGTVGELVVRNGAVNVIPGEVSFSVDLRAPDDDRRRRVEERFRDALVAICEQRGLEFEVEETYEVPACIFDGPLLGLLSEAVVAEGLPHRRIPSGAGHDAMAFADITDTAMLFVRCRDGISHHPDEFVTALDVERALAVAYRTVISIPSLKASK